MEHHPYLSRPVKDRFTRALFISLALHGALAAVVPLLPRYLASLAPPQVVTVSLAESDPTAPRSSIPAPVQPERRSSSLRNEMALPSPVEELSEESPEVEAATPDPPRQAISPDSSLYLGMTRGFFKSLSDGETLRGDVREYYFALVRKVNEQWWTAVGEKEVDAGRGEALVTILMKKDGEILDVRLVKSSESPEYDRMILDAVQAATPLPPLPDSYTGDYFQAPLRLMAPLGLLS